MLSAIWPGFFEKDFRQLFLFVLQGDSHTATKAYSGKGLEIQKGRSNLGGSYLYLGNRCDRFEIKKCGDRPNFAQAGYYHLANMSDTREPIFEDAGDGFKYIYYVGNCGDDGGYFVEVPEEAGSVTGHNAQIVKNGVYSDSELVKKKMKIELMPLFVQKYGVSIFKPPTMGLSSMKGWANAGARQYKSWMEGKQEAAAKKKRDALAKKKTKRKQPEPEESEEEAPPSPKKKSKTSRSRPSRVEPPSTPPKKKARSSGPNLLNSPPIRLPGPKRGSLKDDDSESDGPQAAPRTSAAKEAHRAAVDARKAKESKPAPKPAPPPGSPRNPYHLKKERKAKTQPDSPAKSSKSGEESDDSGSTQVLPPKPPPSPASPAKSSKSCKSKASKPRTVPTPPPPPEKAESENKGENDSVSE